MSQGKNRKPLLFTVIGLVSLAAIWQFYKFVTFPDATSLVDVQAGRHHLWWAIGLGVLACVSAFFFFSSSLRYDRNNEMHITSPPAPKH